ncbi:MAG: ATP-dependent acyl-CoA ligase [Pseudomonadota bacterium]
MTMHPTSATGVAPADRTLPRMLQRQAERFGERPLLRMDGQRWLHGDAAPIAARRAAALAQAGVQRGDRLALMSSNRLEFLEMFLGCGWLGAVVVPVNTASMGPQIGYFLANSGAELLVIEAQWLPRLQTAELGRTRLREIWVLDAEVDVALPDFPGVQLRKYVPDAALDVAPLPPSDVQPGDPLAILYTSGTTGPAKGVISPHAQYHWWGANSADILGVGIDDVLCTTLPLFHINALNTFAQAALTGAEVVFEPRFSASGFWAAMHACGATVVYLLGAMVPILLAQPVRAEERGHRVRVGLGPGVPATASTAFLERTGVALIEGYGSTETSFVIATAPGDPPRGAMGRLRPGFDACVVDAQDVPLPDGEAGELLLRADAPHAFSSGYFQMPDKTVEAWRNLWFHTGDRVLREPDGTFRFIDRIKDAIRRRGENISSYEVEQVLMSHPAVAECAVFPVRSELAEDEVMAALVPRAGCRIDPAELAQFCEARLPYFAVPRYVDLLTDLPRTENGKVQKYRLRERGATAGTWDRGPAPRKPAAA